MATASGDRLACVRAGRDPRPAAHRRAGRARHRQAMGAQDPLEGLGSGARSRATDAGSVGPGRLGGHAGPGRVWPVTTGGSAVMGVVEEIHDRERAWTRRLAPLLVERRRREDHQSVLLEEPAEQGWGQVVFRIKVLNTPIMVTLHIDP